MSSPTVRLNNLVQEDDTFYIDPISKTFLIGEVAFGLNRLVIFRKIIPIWILLAFAYSVVICGVEFYFNFYYNDDGLNYNVLMKVDCVQYILAMVLSSIVWKRLQHYYQKLHEFDIAIGCRPKTSTSDIKNLTLTCIGMFLITLSLPYEWYAYNSVTVTVQQLPMRILHIVETHFYGHLLSLLVHRLRLINYYMKITLNDSKQVEAPRVEELTLNKVILESQNCQMKKLMDLYCMIISAYDVLIDAIKWQFLLVLTSTFISILSFSYAAALMLIRGRVPFVNTAVECAFLSFRLLPVFSPCVFGDQIREEVRRLRELLASRLYENKLNKPGRSVARALLALTEARDLSFTLLQILDIDISLPFKFIGLILTYLIILLQFEKITNP